MAMGISPGPGDSPGEPLVGRLVEVLFRCDAREQAVPERIYIVGNRAELGKWSPNTVMMRDDGAHGDSQAGDGIWSLALRLPEGARILYKYTNSGRPGDWKGSEEFPDINRSIRIRGGPDGRMVVGDRFGVLWGADRP